VRLGPYCGGLLAGVEELALRGATLELASPAVFEGMAALRRLDMEGCTSSRAGSWLSRVLGSSPDSVALPGALRELRALGCNVFDRCALELGGATALSLLELPSGVQLPATLKHVAPGLELGLHVAEEGHVVSRHGRDSYCIKACLAARLPSLRRLWGWGLGRGALGALRDLPELRDLRLLGGDRRRLALDLDMPALEAIRVEGYQLTQVRPALPRLPACLSSAACMHAGCLPRRRLATMPPPRAHPCSCACPCACACTPPCWWGRGRAVSWRCRPPPPCWCWTG
jgi:hypothetical protein